jgi:hypothetical protein
MRFNSNKPNKKYKKKKRTGELLHFCPFYFTLFICSKLKKMYIVQDLNSIKLKKTDFLLKLTFKKSVSDLLA